MAPDNPGRYNTMRLSGYLIKKFGFEFTQMDYYGVETEVITKEYENCSITIAAPDKWYRHLFVSITETDYDGEYNPKLDDVLDYIEIAEAGKIPAILVVTP